MAFLYRNRVGLVLAFFKFVLPFLLQNPVYELHRDEMLYLQEGNHLAWGFMEVPPMLSLFAKAALVLGGNIFWIKLFPALVGALNVFLVCSIARQMGGKTFAQFLGGLCLITGAYLRVHFLFQPGFLEYYCWTLAAYYCVRFINTRHDKYLYFMSLALVCSWYSKYSVAFFVAGVLAGLLLTTNRKVFRSRHIYQAALMAVFLVLPNLYWQYMHRFPVIHHMEELRETQLQFIKPGEFLLHQLLLHTPCFFVWVAGLMWLFFNRKGSRYSLLAWAYVTVLVLLTISNGKDYYMLGAYPMLFAAGGVALEQLTLVKMYWLRYAMVALIFILFIPIVPVLLPVWAPQKLADYYQKSGLYKTGFLKWEDQQEHALPQDFADMICWRELGDKVSKAYANIPDSLKQRTLIYCRTYAYAGAVSYYGHNLGQVTSDNASFLFWMPETYNVRNLLFVGYSIPGKDDEVFQQFERVTILDSTTTPLARIRGVKVILYENGNDKVNSMIEASVRRQKDEFRR